MPARIRSLHHGPVTLPGDPTGIAEPHDVLAAEEFAMPRAAVAPTLGSAAPACGARRVALAAAALACSLQRFCCAGAALKFQTRLVPSRPGAPPWPRDAN